MLIQSQPVSAFEGCPWGSPPPPSHFFHLVLNVVVPIELECGIHDLPRFYNKIWHANNIVYRSVIYRSVCPSPSLISLSLYPRLKNKWAIEAHETSRRNWVNMYAKGKVCICVAKTYIMVIFILSVPLSLSLSLTFTTHIWTGWCKKGFSLFVFLVVNVGCSSHWWMLGSES